MSKMQIQKTFNKKVHISCNNCDIEDLLEFSKNIDEVFLEFLSRFDEGLVTKKGVSKGLKDEGIIRDEKEIKEMIGKNNPDKITESILFSKKDYISQYNVQEEAIEEISFGENVVIEAPTASGKTEAFLIPVIQKIKKESSNAKGVFAVFVYPTKALSRDQHPKILKFAEKIGIDVQV